MQRVQVQLTGSSCLSTVARALIIDPWTLSIDEDTLPNLESFGLDIWVDQLLRDKESRGMDRGVKI